MMISRQKMSATPLEVGSRRYVAVAGDTAASFRIATGTLRGGYARPLYIEIEDGDHRSFVRIPDRQLQIMLTGALVVTLALFVDRRRNR